MSFTARDLIKTVIEKVLINADKQPSEVRGRKDHLSCPSSCRKMPEYFIYLGIYLSHVHCSIVGFSLQRQKEPPAQSCELYAVLPK